MVEALRNITLDLKDGDRVGVTGHNGAGKTTTISMLTGMIEPTDGYISVLG
jgi:ABC-2 type transport system ATP-binding protein